MQLFTPKNFLEWTCSFLEKLKNLFNKVLLLLDRDLIDSVYLFGTQMLKLITFCQLSSLLLSSVGCSFLSTNLIFLLAIGHTAKLP